MTLAPSPRSRSAVRASGASVDADSRISAALPSASCAPVDRARARRCRCPTRSLAACRARARARAPRRRSRAASGCSLPGPGWRRAAAPRPRRTRRAATAARKAGLPSVSVPVLSTTSVSTVRSVSIAAASRNRTPDCAPRPVATMIDIGVARPSAQGQAMISTATALTTHRSSDGSARTSPRREGQQPRSPTTASTNQ